jgi:hypothetical protein
MIVKVQPALVPEDLGIDLEEDSLDVTDEEVTEAIETSSMDDFVRQASDFIKQVGEQPHYERRIKAGILYCRILVGGQRKVIRTDWLRSTR